jgi:hypothetical protein
MPQPSADTPPPGLGLRMIVVEIGTLTDDTAYREREIEPC